MKKFVSLVMAGAMIASMAVAANAVYEAEADAGKVAFEVPKARVAVEYDGVIDVDAGEYYPIEVKDSWLSYAASDDAGITKGKALDAELYMSWDDDGINLATIVPISESDYVQTQTADQSLIWQEAAIQVNYAAADATGTDRLEYGIGRASSDGSFLSNVWQQKNGTYELQLKATTHFVDYVDGALVYETSVPLGCTSSAAHAAEGDTRSVCASFARPVQNPDYIHVPSSHTAAPATLVRQLTVSQRLSLVAAPEIVEPEEPAETTGGEQAAQTADFGIIVSAVLFAASAAGVVVATRKKH